MPRPVLLSRFCGFRAFYASCGVLGLGLALVHCGKTADDATDGGKPSDATPSAPSGVDGGAADASSDSSRAPDAPVGLDAAPPKVTCTADASVCDSIPPSVCADSMTLVYFSAGTCVDGTCTWKQTAMPCGVQSYCVQGGCSPPTTK